VDKVYVVTGSSGDCDDYHTWNVRAFAALVEAEAHRQKLQAISDRERDVQAEWRQRYEATDLNAISEEEYDALMEEEGAGVEDPAHYRVEVVPFGEEAAAVDSTP